MSYPYRITVERIKINCNREDKTHRKAACGVKKKQEEIQKKTPIEYLYTSCKQEIPGNPHSKLARKYCLKQRFEKQERKENIGILWIS